MRALILISLLALAHGAPFDACSDDNCKLPDCHCSGDAIPGGLKPEEVPQMVMLTFDDAVTKLNYENYYVKTLFNRQNPDGCNISATFFSTHEYNDYFYTYHLWRQGHEISLHSITHQTGLDYWKEATVEQLELEYIGQRDILTKFGKIPAEDMKGLRSPFLQMAGDNSFAMMQKDNIEWDCSWGTSLFTNPPIWPYTLDYPSEQECPIPPCPTSSFKGSWEVPMIDWSNEDGVPCSMVDTCPMITDPAKLLEFIKFNFHRHYDSNRAPFPFFIHAAWFAAYPMRFDVYNQFLDYLHSLNDVYIVSISKVIDWVKTPTPISQINGFWKCWEIPEDECPKSKTCELIREDTGEYRYMSSCVASCPPKYPWLGNPLGDATK